MSGEIRQLQDVGVGPSFTVALQGMDVVLSLQSEPIHRLSPLPLCRSTCAYNFSQTISVSGPLVSWTQNGIFYGSPTGYSITLSLQLQSSVVSATANCPFCPSPLAGYDTHWADTPFTLNGTLTIFRELSLLRTENLSGSGWARAFTSTQAGYGYGEIHYQFGTQIPEPRTAALMGAGVALGLALRRRAH